MTIKKKVALLFGGQSYEHEVSLLSSVNIVRSIDREKYDLILISINKQGLWTLCNENSYVINPDNPTTIRLSTIQQEPLSLIPGKKQMLISLKTGKPLPIIDVAFSVLHGQYGEDGSVQGLMNLLNIPYVGSDVLGSSLCMDKDMTKLVLRAAGIAVTSSITVLRSNKKEHFIPAFDTIVETLGLPLFIKPASQGSSIGVSKVSSLDSFTSALLLAFHYDRKVLIEKAITGREIETAVLGNDNPQVSVCGEIICYDNFYSYYTKYIDDKVKFIIPAQLDLDITETIRNMAIEVYLTLGCKGMARVDFFLTPQGQIIVNEVNTLPGLTDISMYPKLWEASGIPFSRLLDLLITLAIKSC